MTKIFFKTNQILLLFSLLLKISLNQNWDNLNKEEIIYPSVLSLRNNGFVVIQSDGIHFYDSNKEENINKKIKFNTPILTKEENDKISISQFPEKQGDYIIIFAINIIYIFREDGAILQEFNFEEKNKYENIKIIPYKKENNNLFYFISYQYTNSRKKFGFNLYKYDLINKKNTLEKNKIIEPIKNMINSKSYDLLGENCILMRNNKLEEDIFACFFGVRYPFEIQVKTFSIKNELLEEKNNYKYYIGYFEINEFNLISAISNYEKDKSIIYYTKNNILSQIYYDLRKGFFNPSTISSEINLPNEYWKEESKKHGESKESLFSSRLYWSYCKSYLIFFNSDFNQSNSGFISHDKNCALLLKFSKYFKNNNYSLILDNTLNNKILIQKRRKLSISTGSIPEECDPTEGVGYTIESIRYGLCKSCNTGYYKVLDPNNTLYDNGQGFIKCLNEATKGNFYLDTTDPSEPIYMPCYETCSSCIERGDAFDNKCKTCATKYKPVINENCEANCAFADYYETYLGYYQCTETNSCPEQSPYLLDNSTLKRCYPDCEHVPGYEWSYAGKCYHDCNEANAIEDNSGLKICRDRPSTTVERCFLSSNEINPNSNEFISSSGVQSYAKTYAKDFYDTTTHVNYFSNNEAIMVIFKDQTCLSDLNIEAPEIDFTQCKQKIIEYYRNKVSDFDENSDIIIALVGGKTSSNGVTTTYSFFYKNGDYINSTELCSDIKFDIKSEIDLAKVNNYSEEIAKQGINIFDLNDPFYTDICFMYDSPNGKDATPNDRMKAYFPNISLCDEKAGCTPKSINLTTFEVVCNCELNDIMNNPNVGQKILDEGFGEILEIIDESNIQIFKCAKDVFVFKHLVKNSGTYITLGIMLAQILCTVFYYVFSYNSMLRYLYYLSEYKCSLIEQKYLNKANNNNKNRESIMKSKLIKIKAPPKKDDKRGNETPSAHKLISTDDSKQFKKNDMTESISKINLNNKSKKEEHDKNLLRSLSKEVTGRTQNKLAYADKLKEDYDVDMDEYLKTDFEDMEFEDVLKKDKRTFCEYYCDRFKETQIIMNTFFNPEILKPRAIKIIILLLNILLYFVVNALFFSEEYVSKLFNSEKDKHFYSFFPRSLSRIFYSLFVGIIIGIIVDFITVEEKKVKRLFLREKRNTLQIRYEISVITTDIKRNYLILMIICLVIGFASLYYLNCFNNVYPNLRNEWIKSSVCIIILMQLLSMLVGLIDALIRLIAFKCKSERIYKIRECFSEIF